MMARTQNLNKSELQVLARLFSPMVIRELGTRGKSGLIGRFLNGNILPKIGGGASSIDQVFDLAFRQIRRPGNRPEYVFTNKLVHKHLLGIHNLNTATVEREFRVGSSRLDLAIFNGTSTAYEIKSDWDSLYRLKGQVADYQKVFENVYVVTSDRYSGAVMYDLPSEVGVLGLTDRFTISTIRESHPNNSSLDVRAIFESLRTEEIKLILTRYDFEVPDVPNTRLRSELLCEFLNLSAEEAHQGMVDVVKSTRSLSRISDVLGQIPTSILPAVITASLTKQERYRLRVAMSTPVEIALAWR